MENNNQYEKENKIPYYLALFIIFIGISGLLFDLIFIYYYPQMILFILAGSLPFAILILVVGIYTLIQMKRNKKTFIGNYLHSISEMNSD